MRKVSVVLNEMIEAIEAARECCAGKDFDAFVHDRLGRLAAERAIEILSEAARHLPEEVTGRHPDIPWPKVKAIGNVLRHEYFRVAPKIIWDVIMTDLGALDVVLREESILLGPDA